ncbi:tRNA (5-methylaminomethyl-2-thiouridine)(34)-methyltransferase MnmD [Hellea balneolensis]|uniref:tRNA (5-methylaminomethyl-2-thiouridine)(34)-methyltransferase MnmD n=1 Tax=Hellea balneolensis TaxID=287478 RepID=UPI00040E96FD|nr:tRNA (5-methylaminomethyl-2-thiouridine)(34)-methyltransferase MnmD [Hellea balneolensis]
MPAPKPLTQCDPPALDWSRPGTPAASDFGDIYFSVDGGLEETETVFLKGCGLPEGWQGRRRFVIGELGFGSGLNFLAAWRMWEATKPKNGRLHFVSVEKFPFDAAQLKRALSAWPELKIFSAALIAQWPGRVKGFHRLHFGDVTLTLIHDDIANGLDSLDAKVDAWFLDGFSPAKNPDMWSSEIMKKLASLSAPSARLATFTVAGTVRQALSEAGFQVEKKEGFGRKRHRLEARYPGERDIEKNIEAPTIIGAGIAGASLVKAFAWRGIIPNVIHDPDHKAASHNAAALVKPRLDLQDRPESRFFLGSYLYALSAYQDMTVMTGVSHIPKTEAESKRFEKLAGQAPLPPEHFSFDVANNILALSRSLIIEPKQILKDWLSLGALSTDKPIKEGLMLLAAGYGLKELLKGCDIKLRFSRGQLTWANGDIDAPVTYGGYALPLNNRLLLGATHQRLDGEDPFALKHEDDASNLKNFKTYTGITAHPSELPSRASVRVTTADTLPMLGEIDEKLWLFSGLGSRGFVFAPLLAEAIVSKICGDPLPVSKTLWARFGLR